MRTKKIRSHRSHKKSLNFEINEKYKKKSLNLITKKSSRKKNEICNINNILKKILKQIKNLKKNSDKKKVNFCEKSKNKKKKKVERISKKRKNLENKEKTSFEKKIDAFNEFLIFSEKNISKKNFEILGNYLLLIQEKNMVYNFREKNLRKKYKVKSKKNNEKLKEEINKIILNKKKIEKNLEEKIKFFENIKNNDFKLKEDLSNFFSTDKNFFEKKNFQIKTKKDFNNNISYDNTVKNNSLLKPHLKKLYLKNIKKVEKKNYFNNPEKIEQKLFSKSIKNYENLKKKNLENLEKKQIAEKLKINHKNKRRRKIISDPNLYFKKKNSGQIIFKSFNDLKNENLQMNLSYLSFQNLKKKNSPDKKIRNFEKDFLMVEFKKIGNFMKKKKYILEKNENTDFKTKNHFVYYNKNNENLSEKLNNINDKKIENLNDEFSDKIFIKKFKRNVNFQNKSNKEIDLDNKFTKEIDLDNKSNKEIDLDNKSNKEINLDNKSNKEIDLDNKFTNKNLNVVINEKLNIEKNENLDNKLIEEIFNNEKNKDFDHKFTDEIFINEKNKIFDKFKDEIFENKKIENIFSKINGKLEQEENKEIFIKKNNTINKKEKNTEIFDLKKSKELILNKNKLFYNNDNKEEIFDKKINIFEEENCTILDISENIQKISKKIKKRNNQLKNKKKKQKKNKLTKNFLETFELISDSFIKEELKLFFTAATKPPTSQKTDIISEIPKIQNFFTNFIKWLPIREKQLIISKINQNFGIPKTEQLRQMSKSLGINTSLQNEYSTNPILCPSLTKNFPKFLKLSPLSKIHSKMLFDAYNEILCSWKPFSFNGEIMPWQNRFGICNIPVIKENKLGLVLEVSLTKLFEWGNLKCGLFGDGFEDFWEVERFREERLERFLNWEVFESDEKWVCYRKEETECVLNMAEGIFQDLVEDLIGDFFEAF